MSEPKVEVAVMRCKIEELEARLELALERVRQLKDALEGVETFATLSVGSKDEREPVTRAERRQPWPEYGSLPPWSEHGSPPPWSHAKEAGDE